MNNMSFQFGVVIAILCLLLVGCGEQRSVSEEVIFDNKEKPKEIVRIDYCAPEEKEELYFEGEKIYEMRKLRDVVAISDRRKSRNLKNYTNQWKNWL